MKIKDVTTNRWYPFFTSALGACLGYLVYELIKMATSS